MCDCHYWKVTILTRFVQVPDPTLSQVAHEERTDDELPTAIHLTF